MRQKKVKKYFEDNPQICDVLKKQLHQYAENTIQDKDIPDFEVFLSRNKAIRTIYAESENPSRVNDKHVRPWFLKRRVFTPLVCGLVLLVFFAFTPIGHAWVEKLITTAVQWYSSGVRIDHASKINTIDQYDISAIPKDDTEESNIGHFNTWHAVRSYMGINIAYCNDHLNDIVDIEVITEDDFSRIQSVYIINYQEVTITQMNSAENFAASANMNFEDANAIEFTHPDNMSFIGYINSDYAYSIAYIDNVSISVHAKNIDYNSYVAILEKIRFE